MFTPHPDDIENERPPPNNVLPAKSTTIKHYKPRPATLPIQKQKQRLPVTKFNYLHPINRTTRPRPLAKLPPRPTNRPPLQFTSEDRAHLAPPYTTRAQLQSMQNYYLKRRNVVLRLLMNPPTLPPQAPQRPPSPHTPPARLPTNLQHFNLDDDSPGPPSSLTPPPLLLTPPTAQHYNLDDDSPDIQRFSIATPLARSPNVPRLIRQFNQPANQMPPLPPFMTR